MQATIAPTSADIDQLAADFFAIFGSLHRNYACELFEKVAELELSITQVKALHLLQQADGELSLKALAEQLGISLPAASRSVDGLHQRELVRRREDEVDRRIKRVRITPAGSAIAAELGASKTSALRELFAPLSDRQRQKLADALAPVLAQPEVAALRSQEAAR
jgi:DNA-binding MarR family transcriptional regulator